MGPLPPGSAGSVWHQVGPVRLTTPSKYKDPSLGHTTLFKQNAHGSLESPSSMIHGVKKQTNPGWWTASEGLSATKPHVGGFKVDCLTIQIPLVPSELPRVPHAGISPGKPRGAPGDLPLQCSRSVPDVIKEGLRWCSVVR